MRIKLPDPPLADSVVALRPWAEEDVPAIVAGCREEEIERWLDQVPQPYTERDAREYIASTRRGWREGTVSNFAIVDAETGEPAGSIGVHWLDHEHGVAEVGYWIRREFRGRGLATRALRLVAGWVLGECGAQRLQLRADSLNEPSQRVAEKAGFQREGVLRSIRFNARQGRRVDFVMYSLLPGEL